MPIINRDKSVIPACDVATLEKLKAIVNATCSIEGVGGYKVGCTLTLMYGLKQIMEAVRDLTDLPVIYDHQKAGTDIPALGEKFMDACKRAGVNAVILFPQAGPVTEEAWISAARQADVDIIVGGEMTHEGYMKSDNGWILDESAGRIFEIAANMNVTDFVVPGNKPDKITEYRNLLLSKDISPVLYSPGLIAQGGEITAAAEAAGDKWHAIIGRAIYDAGDMSLAAKKFTKKI
ncbi:MAG: orotidine 5'-phosphate decarboxylase / HUMPS family protein [archaeon]